MLTQDPWKWRDWLCDGHARQVKNNGSPAWDRANPLSSGLEQQPGLGAKRPPPGESLYLKMKPTANSRAEDTDHQPGQSWRAVGSRVPEFDSPSELPRHTGQ